MTRMAGGASRGAEISGESQSRDGSAVWHDRRVGANARHSSDRGRCTGTWEGSDLGRRTGRDLQLDLAGDLGRSREDQMKRCLVSDAREVRGLQVYPHVPATTHRTTCGVSTRRS